MIKTIMMKKVVIIGSAKLQSKIQYWEKFWENKGYKVIDLPQPIHEENFLEMYPEIYKNFFKNIKEADILFVMNENKNGISGYIGAESFAEIGFGVTQNLIHNKNIEIILLKKPEKQVQAYDEIKLWLQLGWIKLFKDENY